MKAFDIKVIGHLSLKFAKIHKKCNKNKFAGMAIEHSRRESRFGDWDFMADLH